MNFGAALRPQSRRGWLLVILAIIVVLMVFMPLRLALAISGEEDTGLSARSASGTIWDGRLTEARLGALEVGTLDVGLRAWPMLLGRASLDFASVGNAASPFSGAAEYGWGQRALHDVSGTLSGGRIGEVPVERVTLEGLTAVFAGDRCVEARGRVRIVLAIDIAGFTLRNGLSGTARCDNGALLLPLVGDSGVEQLRLRIEGDGRYRGQLGAGGAAELMRFEGRL